MASMSTTGVRDALTLTRRNLLHMVRYPSLTVMLVGQPVLMLVLFVYVFGGTMGAGLPGGTGRSDYLHFITPGVLVMAVASVGMSTAILIAKDATEGIIDRFRTMAISRSAPLSSHVVAALVQTVLAVVVVTAVAIGLGYRPDWSVAGLAGALAVLVLLGVALTWLCVALGLASGSVEAASNTPMPLVVLPFLSSGFVPTDSMPGWLGWVAQHQPITPFVDTLRACLDGASPGSASWWALGWCVLISALSSWWASRLFGRVRAG
jgi:ABC-2 type transport system permease protein